jgi:hypothetical protein
MVKVPENWAHCESGKFASQDFRFPSSRALHKETVSVIDPSHLREYGGHAAATPASNREYSKKAPSAAVIHWQPHGSESAADLSRAEH